jgi:hypothetical protein
MKANQQTIQQIERTLRKVAAKFPVDSEPVMTDLHMQVIPYTGEIRTYDDDDEELDRCVIEQWIHGLASEEFYAEAENIIRQCIKNMRSELYKMSILHPFSYVLVDEEHETLSDIYLMDDDQIMIDGELLAGLDEDLDRFLHKLLSEE